MKTIRFLPLLSIFLLSACGLSPVQQGQVATFASATDAIASLPATNFARLRQDIIQMNTEYVMLNDRQTSLKGFNLDAPLSVKAATQRALAVTALQSYGDTLHKLVTADESTGIKNAATNLVTNFNSAASANLTTSQQSAATDLTTTLGTLFVDYERKQAVEKIVSIYACPVDQLAALLERDFRGFGPVEAMPGAEPPKIEISPSDIPGCSVPQSTGDPAVGVLWGYEAAAGRLKNIAIGIIGQGNAVSFDKRQSAVKAFVLAVDNDSKAQNISAAGVPALVNLRKANAKLGAALKDDKLTVQEIKDYATSIKQLVATVNVLTTK